MNRALTQSPSTPHRQSRCRARATARLALLGASLAASTLALGADAETPELPEYASVARPAASHEWVIAEGETLQSIAEALYPRSKRHQRRFIEATIAANPSLGARRYTHAATPLSEGERIIVPDLRRLANAATPIESWPLRPPKPRADQAERQRDGKTGRNRLSLSAGTGGDSTMRTPAPKALQQRERVLLTAMDNHTAAQLVLAERIRRIEAAMDGLRRSAAAHNPAAPGAHAGTLPTVAAPAPATAAPVARPELAADQSESASERNWWVIALGLTAVAAALLVLRSRLRRADSEPLGFLDSIEPKGAHSPVPPPNVELRREPSVTSTTVTVDEVVVRHAQEDRHSALELAEIMLAFGRVEGAAQTLAEYIGTNPHEAVQPWLKLLEVYHGAGMRADFDTLAVQLHRAFNVEVPTWDGSRSSAFADSIEGYPHLMDRVTSCWGTPDCSGLIDQLLRDNRTGARSGFPLPVIEQLAFLFDVLEARRSLG